MCTGGSEAVHPYQGGREISLSPARAGGQYRVGVGASPHDCARPQGFRGWRIMKQIIDLRPVHHRLEERIRAHVVLCSHPARATFLDTTHPANIIDVKINDLKFNAD